MYGAKAPRHVFLLDRMLLIVKRKEDGTLGYKAHIMVPFTGRLNLILYIYTLYYRMSFN
jgi:hypothetical protein